MKPIPGLPASAAAAGLRRAVGPVAGAVLAGLLASIPAVARSAELRVIASDRSGVTLRLEVGDYSLESDPAGGRVVPSVDGLGRTDVAGRPRLPFGATLLALPPGARAVARVLASGPEDVREGTRIAIAEKSEFVPDDLLGRIPVLTPQEPIRDGVWPASALEVGEVFTMRERRLVPLRVFPFRYDEDGARLTLTRSITVRVDFAGGRPSLADGGIDDAPDPQFDPVFATQVANWEDGRGWRARRPAARDGGLLPGRGTALSQDGRPRVDAFDESEIEVRVRVDTTGVYGIEYDSLAAYGYPAAVPVGEVSVHRHEFLQDQTPPYGTIDLPCEVDDDDGDGFFGPGDRVVVWVWDWAQRGRISAPQRVWGDAEVIFVTRRAAAARIERRRGWLDRNDLVPLASYPTRRRYERNLSMTGFPIDTVLDQFTWNNFNFFCTPEAFPFETTNLDPTAGATVTVSWVGLNSTPKYTWARVRNGLAQDASIVDSAAWFGIRAETRTGNLAPGALTEGATNSLRIWGKLNASDACPNPNALVFAGLNWFEVTYWRQFRPIRNYLPCNSGNQTSAFEIRAGPYVNPFLLRAYDVTDSTRPFRLDDVDISTVGSDVYLRLQDTASPSLRRQYVVFDIPKSPAPGAMSAVTRHRIFDRPDGDYLVIVPEGFRSAIQPLVNLRAAQGLRVVVAPLEGIQDEFNGGRKSAYAIRRFIRYAYNNWNARFVLLVGDGSEDPRRHFSTSSPDIVPVQKMFGPVPVPVGSSDYLPELVPADFWYVWCVNCPVFLPGSLKPDLFIGRLPAGNVSQVTGMVSKLVAYENLAGDQSWRQKMVLLADDQYSGQTTFGGPGGGSSDYCRRGAEARFLQINAVLDSLVRKRAGLAQAQVDVMNLSYYVPNRLGEFTTSGGVDTCRTSQTVFQTRARATATPELFSRLNAGRLWWNYQGHANEYVVSHENLYLNQTPTDDKGRFTNDGRPFLFTAFSCHPNSFGRAKAGNDPQYGPAFGEELVTLPGRGAIASWASVGYESLPIDPTNHVNIHLANALFVNPPRDEYLGDRGSRVVLGEAIYAALLANFTGRSGFAFERDVSVTYTLLGDPATRLSIGAPQAIVTANGQPVTHGQDIRLTSSGPGLTLAATLVSTVRLDSIRFERRDRTSAPVTLWRSSDPTLPAGLTVSPAFPDTARATSQSGGRRFLLTYADNLRPDNYRYIFRTWDRYGLESVFEAVFGFQAIVRVGGQAISDGDFVSPVADLSILVLSPRPLAPQTDLTLTLNGRPASFTESLANGDVSGREWLLTVIHDPFTPGEVSLDLAVAGGITTSRRLRVAETGLAVRIENAMAFPNPFDDDYIRALNPGFDIATVFSFDLISAAPVDVTLRVYSIAGRLIYQRTERRLDPRWHQIPWDGRDAEGFPLANGVYFYKLLADNGTGTAVHEGRLVKLRRPRRSAVPEPAN